ncbi:DUF4157 domain-containing protein [Psychromonas sp.]|uniref:eCIS core domain-containing protein n=1 Tax=Psychromonas sp. TaxID=1884585 RepID=UPI0039E6CCBE
MHSHLQKSINHNRPQFKQVKAVVVSHAGSVKKVLQPKLKIGPPNDKYEQEADRVAEQVMAMSKARQASPVNNTAAYRETVQRVCSKCEGEELLQKKSTDAPSPYMTADINSKIDALKTGGQPLSSSERSFFEPRFEADFSDVRLHRGQQAADTAQTVHARAFTYGNNVVFGAGQYSSDSTQSRKLLAHELTHVVQQNGRGNAVSDAVQRQTDPTTMPPCSDELRDAQNTAAVLVAAGRRGSAFLLRLNAAERADWRDLSALCRSDPEQCPSTRTARLSRLHGRIHAALDVPAPIGSAVYAPIRGRVLIASSSTGGYGNNVLLQHDCPPRTSAAGDRPVSTFYAHLDSLDVSAGDDVAAGSQVGSVGMSGRGEGAVREGMQPHLHFSVQAILRGQGPTSERNGNTRFRGSDYEERASIRIHPRQWLTQLGIAVVPLSSALAAQEAQQPETSPEPSDVPVRRKESNSLSAETSLKSNNDVIQRLPLDEQEHFPAGGTLPYASARELHDCISIMGEENAAFCREELLGPPPGQLLTELDIGQTGVALYTTSVGQFYRFPAVGTHTNNRSRPQFQHPQSSMVQYSGAADNGSAFLRPEIVNPLNRMMSAMRAEGARLNDQSLLQAFIAVGYRPPNQHEGDLYLDALRRTIILNPDIFGTLTFPAALLDDARSELGFSGSTAHRHFRDAVAAQPGWNAALAQQLVRITAGFKAPRGGSTHHSGLVVDINFPYAVSNSNFQMHGINRSHNANALRAAAGVWLSRFSTDFGFDSYNTQKEIWHMEWRNWPGSTADPSI